MSLRPRTPGTRTTLAQSRMAPGGRRWSESPVPRVGVRRVRAAGAPPPLCTNTEWAIGSETSTSASFTGLLGYTGLSVTVTYDCTATGAVDVRVRADGNAWTAYQTITGPNSGFLYFYPADTGGNVTVIDVEWDTPNAFETLCAVGVNNE